MNRPLRSKFTSSWSPSWFFSKGILHPLTNQQCLFGKNRTAILVQLIGLREKLQEKPIFHGKICGFLVDFPLSQPIDWYTSIPSIIMTSCSGVNKPLHQSTNQWEKDIYAYNWGDLYHPVTTRGMNRQCSKNRRLDVRCERWRNHRMVL